MKSIGFDVKHAMVTEQVLKDVQKKIASTIQEVHAAMHGGYDSPYAAVNVPFDVVMHNQVKRVIATKKALQPHLLIVIGIGGSNLGTMAVLQALFGCFYNEKRSRVKVFFADTVDTDYILDLYNFVQTELQKGAVVLLNVISKSGTTTETVANFYIFFDLLRSFYPQDFHKYVVVTSDRDSVLHRCAEQYNFTFLEIPRAVGGRYSVCTAVGLFPLGLLDVDIDAFAFGARVMAERCSMQSTDNYAVQTAVVRYELYKKGYIINDLFLFSVDFENIGKWYRQLMGESIGKENDIHGKRVERGITPTISLGTVDLHSVAQLYLGGPRDKLFMFVDIESPKSHCYIPAGRVCNMNENQLIGKSVSSVQHAIFTGVCRAFEQTKRPYMKVIVPEKTPYFIGQLLQYMMIEMMYLGTLLEVNPFDQPNVELYKQETRKILRDA